MVLVVVVVVVVMIRVRVVNLQGLMVPRIEPLADELLAKVSIPEVLDLIIRPTRYSPRYQRPPVAKEAVEAEDEVLFVRGDGPTVEVGAEVVHPPEAAAFPAPEEAGAFG